MLTQTKIEIEVRASDAKPGIVMLMIDGEATPLSADDAEAIGKLLRAAAYDAECKKAGK